ncbi:uncharacterized protein LOC126570254 [Anopheles aquasalis]|uniref:uncharacterized protein LOC126570254 n=1 Tax=Anopheles aquasalis TaxID=42839 RepID=UPI00215AB84E|nr:uncharacterized protein LOC126570254 [Anopheles aquasalis]
MAESRPGPSAEEPATPIRKMVSFDLLDELELLLHRKGRLAVVMVTVIVLALCFLVVGFLMATGILLITFFLFIGGISANLEVDAATGLLPTTFFSSVVSE